MDFDQTEAAIQEVQENLLRSRLTVPHRRFASENPSFLSEIPASWFKTLKTAIALSRRRRCETGFSWQLDCGQKSLRQAQLGRIISGDAAQITLEHDPDMEYFCHRRGRLPLLMLHVHPSGRLGFSRSDCLAANEIVRESSRQLKNGERFTPIFAVAVDDQKHCEVLLVQRKLSGEFMEFSEVGQAYDLNAWLSCPAFNVAHFSVGQNVSDIKIHADTGIIAPIL